LTIDCDYETSGSVVPNTGVLVTNVTYRNISGTVTHPRPRAGGGGGGRRSAARSRAAAEGHDPSMVVDTAGTFFCRDTRPCSFSMQQVQIAHATPVDGHTNASSSETPPAWLCNNSRLLGGRGRPACSPASLRRAETTADRDRTLATHNSGGGSGSSSSGGGGKYQLILLRALYEDHGAMHGCDAYWPSGVA